jgi:hypothetical protein
LDTPEKCPTRIDIEGVYRAKRINKGKQVKKEENIMKKILAILTFLIMALTATLPLVAADPYGYYDSIAIEWYPDEGGQYPQDASATGAVTYDTSGSGSGGEPGSPGGGTTAPLKILAIWETGEYYLDADTTQIGCQIDPPMMYDGWVGGRVYVAIEDPDDVLPPENGIKIDISWPDNDLYDDLGFGGIPTYDPDWDNIEPVYTGDWYLDYLPAHDIDYGYNQPFICYYNAANDGVDLEGYYYLEWAFGESNLKIFYIEFELWYCYPAGWYDVHVAVQGPTVDQQMNYFEYDMGIGAEIDFDYLDWGTKIDINKWYDYDGDWDFDVNEVPQRPTIRNIGNWDAEIGVMFGHGDFDPDYVLFDVRMGNSNPAADNFNPTMAERLLLDGLEPNVWYDPLPVDNYDEVGDEYRDDVLLKCHTYKMDFYLNPLQWNVGEGLYEFPITIYVETPDWHPVYVGPCPIATD